MPLIPLPQNSVINIQAFGSCNGQRIINLFQYVTAVTPNPATDYLDYMDSALTAWIAAGGMHDAFIDAMPANYQLDFWRFQPVAPNRLRFVDYPQAAGGQWPTDATTSNVASSIERFGRLGARRGIGRVQLVVPSDAYTIGRISNGGYQAVLNTLAVKMRNQLVSVLPNMTYFPCIHNTVAPQPLTVIVEGTIPQDTVRTMHRRTVGLGI